MTYEKVTHTKVVLVEGKDEVNFFDALLTHLGVSDVGVREVGGRDRFPEQFAAFRNDPGFGRVRALAIVRDADFDPAATLASVRDLLGRHSLPCPRESAAFAAEGGRSVGVYIMPGESEHGMLEDLCLKTVGDHPVFACVEQYMACLTAKLKRHASGESRERREHYYPKNEAKAKAHAFLAGMYEVVPSVGVAAQKGYWDLDHMALDGLKRFLSQLG